MTLKELQAAIKAGNARLDIPEPVSPSCNLCGTAVAYVVTAHFAGLPTKRISLCSACENHLNPKVNGKSPGAWPEPCKTFKEVK